MTPSSTLNIIFQTGITMTYDEKQETLVKLIGMVFILIVICLIVLTIVLLVRGNKKKKQTKVNAINPQPKQETPVVSENIDLESKKEALVLKEKQEIFGNNTETTHQAPIQEKIKIEEEKIDSSVVEAAPKSMIENKPSVQPITDDKDKEDKLAQLRKRIEEIKKEKEQKKSESSKFTPPTIEVKPESVVSSTSPGNDSKEDKLDALKRRIEDLKKEKEVRSNVEIQEKPTTIPETPVNNIEETILEPSSGEAEVSSFEINLENAKIEDVEEQDPITEPSIRESTQIEEETIIFFPNNDSSNIEETVTNDGNYPIHLRTFSEWLEAFKTPQKKR